jgi:lipoprotein-anchoring transpeptidase ErfK/SrfK
MMAKGSARSRVARWVPLVVAVLALTGMAGCAAAPPSGEARVMQPDDFKMLAGNWYGSEVIQQAQPQAIQAVVQETGAFFTVLRGAPGAQRPGIMKIADGKVTYETATQKGTMTFHESTDGKAWIWKWQGTTTDGSAVRNELTKAK